MTEINLERFRKIQIYLEQTRYFQVNLDNAKKNLEDFRYIQTRKIQKFSDIYLVIFRSIQTKKIQVYLDKFRIIQIYLEIS